MFLHKIWVDMGDRRYREAKGMIPAGDGRIRVAGDLQVGR